MVRAPYLWLLLLHIFLPSAAIADNTFRISGVKGSADSSAAVEVVKEAYRRLGYGVDVVWMASPESLKSANSGTTDAELQRIDGISSKYTNLIQIPIPINILQAAVFSKGVPFDIVSWHSLFPYRIGVVKGIIFAEQGVKGMQVTKARNYNHLIEMLQDDTVEVAVLPRINGLHTIKQMRAQGIREMKGVLETLFLYHYVHKSHRNLVPALQRILKEMLNDGTTRRLSDAAYKRLLEEE